jgi:Protein kinase domain/AAA ATPase domain
MQLLRCGHPETGGRFCPECGALAVVEEPSADPFTGRTIGERYLVGELINVGGMGRVYRGIQTSLDRPIAIKLIHPHLLTSEEVVGRFLTEARASSKLNHPNVVSIYDFGRMPASEGGHLFLVMELLGGRDLRAVIDAKRLSLPRVADVLGQTLAALGEAHHIGITHRDVKPENILIETRRDDSHLVKVIDFGIARIGGDPRKTQAGRVFGTPWYMAPEQASGAAVGPSADLYAVGVLLFEMLTGVVPFDDEMPASILLKQLTAPRPDPRVIAPLRKIPDALAEVCMKALSIEPDERFPDAETFAAAIMESATRESWTAGRSSMFPRKSPAPARDEGLGMAETAALHATVPRDEGLAGREEDLAAILDLVAEPGEARGLVLHGPAGVGRTRLLAVAVGELRGRDVRVITFRARPRPAGEVSLGGLAQLVPVLTGLSDEELLEEDDAGDDVTAGLAAILRHEIPREQEVEATQRAVAAALAWAARRAVERAGEDRIVVAIDDVDEMDPVSHGALEDLLECDTTSGLFVLMTSEQPPDVGLARRIRGRALRGLSREDAQRLLGDVPLPPGTGDIEPLYLDTLRRFRLLQTVDDPPATLNDLVAMWLRHLLPAERRTIQALAVTGASSLRQLGEVLPRPDDLDDALRSLAEGGVVVVEDGQAFLSNTLYGRIALANASSGAVAELHSRALALIDDAPHSVELRAHHALRGEPSFETFVLVENAARERTRCGSDEATIALLWDGIRVARDHELRGDAEAQVAVSARIVFGRKLGEALVRSGRLDQAQGVLAEVLELAPQRDSARAQVLEGLAAIAHNRGRPDEADKRRAEASMIADYAGDRELADRLRAPMPRIETRPPRKTILKTPMNAFVPRVGGSGPPSRPRLRADEQ